MGKMIKTLLTLGLAALLTACGDNGSFFATGISSSGAASVTLLVSSPQLGSGDTTGVTITAVVKDSGNLVTEGIPVVFSASSGALAVSQGTTDASGQAIAVLTPGSDFTNRTVTVTATTGSASQTATVDITGTSVSIGGETTIVQGNSTILTATLTDSASNGISGATMTISSSLGSTLSASTLTTDSTGKVSVTVTGATAGVDTITFLAAGVTATHTLTISGDQFQISAPTANTEIPLSTPQAITANWLISGTPQVGQTVNFSATRGTLTATSAVTDASGNASVSISSTSAGPSTITAQVSSGPSASKPISFVATVPATVNLQTDKTSIGPNDGSQTTQQQATLTATVRDANNNLVKGQSVSFTILADVSGGSLTSSTVVTDSLGKASTTYISSAATTAKDGVQIQASVSGITDTVTLSVAQSALFISLGTGNQILVPNETTYAIPFSVILTDANGNADPGKNINISIEPISYYKGQWNWNSTDSVWVQTYSATACPNEDANLNGVLDTGEDLNSNFILDPGNVTSTPGTVTTGTDGSIQFNVTYAQQYALWVKVRLTASRTVAGTESLASSMFYLPIPTTEISSETAPPPGTTSPFGAGNSPNNVCTNVL